jgi:AhpD family alkylhydroperoxidase
MGVIPNLIAKMANSPALLHGYLAADGALSKGTSSVEERQLILLAASVENECQYCVAAHTTSVKHFGAQSAVIAAVKQESRTGANKLGALIVLPPRWPAAREDPR